MGNPRTEFSKTRMKKFLKTCMFSQMQFKDLKKRNPQASEEYILEVLFNSNVLGDSYAERKYMSV